MHASSCSSVMSQHRLCPGRRFWHVEQQKMMLPKSAILNKPPEDAASHRIFSCSQKFAEWRHSRTIVTNDNPRSVFASPSSRSAKCKSFTRRSCCVEDAYALGNVDNLVLNF